MCDPPIDGPESKSVLNQKAHFRLSSFIKDHFWPLYRPLYLVDMDSLRLSKKQGRQFSFPPTKKSWDLSTYDYTV